MTEPTASPSSQRRLERRFDRLARRRRPALCRRFGEEAADEIVAEARREYRRLVPEVTALRRGLLNGALAGTYESLAYYKALRRRGCPVEEIGGFYHDSYRSLIGRYPSWLLALVFRLARPWLRARLRREAAQSQREETPGGWRFEYVEGRKGEFDFGFDVSHCAVCALFSRHQAEEVVPYLCALDDEMSEILGMGLRRSGTRALGASCCDFRYGAAEPQPLRARHSLPVVSAQAGERGPS